MREVEFCEILLGAEVLIYMFAVHSMYLVGLILRTAELWESYVIVLYMLPICLQIVFHVPWSSDCLAMQINLPSFHQKILELNASKEKQICRSKFSKSALPNQMHCYNSNASETSEPWNFRHECKNWRDKPDSKDHLEQTTDCTWISKTRIEVEGVLAVPLGHVIQQGDEVCLILVSLRRLSSQ